MIPSMVKRWEDHASQILYVPIDLETGGLNNATHDDDLKIPEGRIGANTYPVLEITAKFLDGNLQEVAEPMTFVISHSKEKLMETCSDWSIKQFKDTLFIECDCSVYGLAEVDKVIAERINSIDAAQKHILGNSVDLDRSFIVHQMPMIAEALHYRIGDISTLKTIFGGLFAEAAKFQKTETHRTEDDINETIAELQFYLANFIKSREIVAREQLDA